jgi:cysteine-rich repeat protein
MCGNSIVDSGETCDDGNTVGGDGCTAHCALEVEQNVAQQKCINGMNKSAWKLAKTQGKANSGCIKSAVKGAEAYPQGCLVRDAKGKVAKAQSKVAKADQRSCTWTPDFGYTGADAINAAAVAGELGLVSDVFGSSLNPILLGIGENKGGALCQAAIAKDYEKILSATLDSFVRCKKAGLKSGHINSSARLEECFDEVASDPRGKVTKAVAKVAKRMTKKCGAYLIEAFPGQCSGVSGASNFAGCLGELADCRACQMLNAFDGLSEDCDLFDDGLSNGTCGDTTLPRDGVCPLPTGVGICVEECSTDSDCSAGAMCCSNGCGHVCMTELQ